MTKDILITSEDVAEIITILDKTPYDRLDVRIGRFTLRVIRSGEGWSQEFQSDEVGGPAAAVRPEELNPEPDAVSDDQTFLIRPPLPGTLYRAPQPGAPAFVEVGDRVEPDTVIAIIETMKLMTSVSAGCSGTIEAILAENAAIVDSNSVLMRVRLDIA
jgi:acetyl-CoA carboxylase biotin carboxyl carrier protein